jgi:hypothetical protein
MRREPTALVPAGCNTYPKSCKCRFRFFFDGVPGQSGAAAEIADSDLYVNGFLATSDGLALVQAFVRIRDPKLRRAIVLLVQQITPEDD